VSDRYKSGAVLVIAIVAAFGAAAWAWSDGGGSHDALNALGFFGGLFLVGAVVAELRLQVRRLRLRVRRSGPTAR
jgi:uncharacterized membrane protein YhaH (DUF805 family)